MLSIVALWVYWHATGANVTYMIDFTATPEDNKYMTNWNGIPNCIARS